jgi:hypothetical protein
VKQRLTPGGVATFYVQLFETNLPAVRSTLATFFEVFPSGTIWGNTHDGQGYDLVMLGQSGPLRIDLDEIDARLQRPDHAAVASSLREIGMSSAVDLYATYAGRGEDLVPWLRDAAINRDWNLRMQYLAGTALNADDSAAIYRAILRYRRLPVDLFAGAPGRIDTLRAGIRRGVD